MPYNCISAKISRVDMLEATCLRKDKVEAVIKRQQQVTAILSKVCDAGLYLIASPSVVWVSPELIKQINIQSNTKWFIG